jgi:hypothetical protein
LTLCWESRALFGTQWATLMDPEGNEFDIGKGMG